MLKSTPAPADVNLVTKTTTFKEVVPAGPDSGRGLHISPDFFQFVRDIPDNKVGDYMCYLYRQEPGRVQIDHTPGKTFDVPGFGLVPVLDQEALESVVAQDCGGGIFKLICNKRSNGEMQAQQSFKIDLPPRQITPWYIRRGENQVDNTKGGGKSIYSSDPTAAVAQAAISTMANQEHKAIDMSLKMMDTAFNGMERAVNMSKTAPAEDETTRLLHAELLKRALADPLELLLRLKQLNPEPAPAATNGMGAFREMMGFLREMGVSIGNAAPAVSAGAEMVRAVPGMISTVVEGIRELRIKAEIDRDTAAIMYRQPQPPPRPGFQGPPQQVLQPAPVPSPTQPGPPPPPPGANGGVIEPNFAFVQQKIVEIMRQSNLSAEEAAEEVIGFLENLSGENPTPDRDIVAQLCQFGEKGLMDMFQSQPLLKPATANHARLVDFIRAFLRIHAQDVAEAQVRPN